MMLDDILAYMKDEDADDESIDIIVRFELSGFDVGHLYSLFEILRYYGGKGLFEALEYVHDFENEKLSEKE